MAASSKISILKDYSGKVNNQFVLKIYGDKSVICRLPKKDKRKKRTPGQLENNKLMMYANGCAKAILKNPAKRDAALLLLNVTRNKLYTTLVSLYFKQAKEAKAKGEDRPGSINLTTNG